VSADERAEAVRQLIFIQSTLRLLRDHVELTGRAAKAVGSLGLSFAAYHLADSISGFGVEVTKFVAEDMANGETKDGEEV
jgi:hypothetical protein